MDESLWTEVRGRKSDGQKSVDESPMDRSPTYIGRVELSRRCGDGGHRRNSSQRNTTAMAGQRGAATMQARATVARVAAALLQHASRERYDTVFATLVAPTLRCCCCSTCRESATALLQQASLQRCCNSRYCSIVAAML